MHSPSLADRNPERQPHSLKLALRSAAFGVLVAASVVIGQLLWQKLLPESVVRGVELMMFPALPVATFVAAVVAGGLAYCEARWPKQAMAALQASVHGLRYGLLACVVGLILITVQ